MFKDEAPYLKEWIEYHRLLGFEHFWLYSNNSEDNYLEVLQPYIKQGIVDLYQWPSPIGKTWITAQALAYKDCLWKCKDKTKWIAMIDSDEFIVPKLGKSDFVNTMREFEKMPDCGGVILYWLMYGTSHLYDIPEGQLQMEALLLRSSADYPPNGHVKTICRPERVKHFMIHIAEYNSPFRHYTIGKSGIPDQPLQPVPIEERIRINHYWTRTQRYMDEIKVPRRKIYNTRPYSQEELDRFEIDLNVEYDDSILPFVPELKTRLLS